MTPLFLLSGLWRGYSIQPPPFSPPPWLLHPGLRCERFVLGLQGIQRGYLILDGVDAIAPCLVLGVQRVGVVGQGLAGCLCLGILDGFVIVAVKLRFQRVALAVESVLLLDDF